MNQALKGGCTTSTPVCLGMLCMESSPAKNEHSTHSSPSAGRIG